MTRLARRAAPVALALAALSPARASEEEAPPAPPAAEAVVRRWLALDRVDARARHPFNPDAVIARHLLDRAAAAPAEGEEVRGSSGAAAWRAVEAATDGTVEPGSGAWWSGTVEVPEDRVLLARLEGAALLFVNGDGFAGDVYRNGTGPVPVALRAGANRLLVAGPRGPWRLAFEPLPEAGPAFREDATLGDAVRGTGPQRIEVSWKVVNPSLHWEARPRVPTEPLPPLGVGKFTGSFEVDPDGEPPAPSPERAGFEVRFADPGEPRRVPFRSSVDGTVQVYGYRPEIEGTLFTGPVSTVLSLHGAGVDALAQARAYGPKADFRVVAPTNRRPFGFDWQDWGRRDAYEALEDATRRFRLDPGLVHLTGHSMGGHGAWHLAANDPDRWAAVAPSAGWRSFDTYGGGPRPETPLAPLWRGADFGSRTEDLVANLLPLPVFVLHGRADDTVPVSEGEAMVEALARAGRRPLHHFAEGAGHWWDGEEAAGADCLDWPGIFDLFRRSRRAWFPEVVAFASADPSIDRQEHWVRVEQPLRYGEPFRVEARRTPAGFRVRTENCRRLQILDLGAPPVRRVDLDGTPFVVPDGEEAASFLRTAAGWTAAPPPGPGEKDAWLSGPFKRAFDRRFVLVIGTRGSEEESRELLALARWHSQQWWYRANGNAPVVRDDDFLGHRAAFAGRNLVLYGNEETNGAWKAVVPDSCPVRVRRGGVSVGGRAHEGTGLGALLVHPRADDPGFLVGAFGSTGPRGTRLGYALLPFTSGVGYPDWAVFGEEALRSGDGGVLAAGWFDHGWALQDGGLGR
jgi:dienelactone hydrolase